MGSTPTLFRQILESISHYRSRNQAHVVNELILYTTEDGRSQIKLRAQEQTVWLTQLEMAELFDASARLER